MGGEMALALEGLRVIDADTHFTEPADLWTKRAPAKYAERVPTVKVVDGRPLWFVDGSEMGFAGGGGVIDRQGGKGRALEALYEWTQDEIHRGAFDPKARIEVMDDSGIYAQVCFPNSIGLGGQGISDIVKDPELRLLCVQIYNDAMAEVQADSGNRLLPMPVLPAWDPEESAREAERVAGMGLRGVNMTSDTQDLGAPDLANRAWDPVWDVCADLQLPVHFHIGASLTTMTYFGTYPWESQDEDTKLAIGGTLLFIGNARVVTNIILSGLLDRHPTLKMVSVESGVGWIPFILEALDYEMSENAPKQLDQLSMLPSEYFRRNLYATFWFEKNNVPALIAAVGEDNVLFETDFPHPTCLYPKPLETVADKMSTLTPAVQRKVLGENAAALYRL
jgi:predicted TIM-barrel fold metal-dependent hydrolase